jgi:threonine/homoserine/homoserine lactone efflux protein
MLRRSSRCIVALPGTQVISVEDPIVFVLAVLAVLATPGPTNTLMAIAGATIGVSRALKLIAAEATGYLASISLLILTLRAVLTEFPWAAAALKFTCGSYLAVLAIIIWRRSSASRSSGLVNFQRVFMTTLLNPKGLIFAFHIFPAGGIRLTLHFLSLFTLICSATALLWICVGAVLRSRTADFVSDIVIHRTSAAVLGMFAAVLLTNGVTQLIR